MKKSLLLAATAVVGAGVAFQGSVNLQATTPGTPQTGHSNITGTAKAGIMVGYSSTPTGIAFGGDFRSASTSGRGVLGNASATSGVTYGGLFQSFSTTGRGIAGIAVATSGFTVGGFFTTNSPTGKGIQGSSNATTGLNYGVYGRNLSPGGFALFGEGNVSATGVFSGNGSGLTGVNANLLDGLDSTAFLQSIPVPLTLSGTSATHIIRGENASTAGGSYGVLGYATASTGSSYGVYGLSSSTSGLGVLGLAGATSGISYGVYGQSYSTGGTGVYGWAPASSGTTYGMYGRSDSSSGIGVLGHATAASGVTVGLAGVSNSPSGRGVDGFATASGPTFGVVGTAQSAGYGLYAFGRSGASGTKTFRIDHPFDPENKYLLHYSHEGPEPQNVYNGNVVTDARGYATIALPDYFEEINKDPRYTLTVIDDSDDFVLAKVVREVRNNRFVIRTNKPSVKVSWEVKAVRNDLWVQKRGAPVEVDKEGLERGTYQHPEFYGLGPERGMNYDPERAKKVIKPKAK